MALKPDRHEVVTDISFFMNETAERGIIVTHSTAGSGAAMDDSNALVAIPTTASGSAPAGLLLNDVVNIDLTRQHLNQHQYHHIHLLNFLQLNNSSFYQYYFLDPLPK